MGAIVTSTGTARATPRTRRLLRIATGVLVAAAVTIGVVVVLPTVQAAGAALLGADLLWIAVAVACEAGALVAFSVLHHRLLVAASVQVSLHEVTLATLAANALHLTVPGGAALSTAYTYKRRRAWGATAPATTWTMVAGGVAASLALAAIAFGSALVVGGRPTSLPWMILQIAGVAALGAGVVLVARRPGLLVTAGTWGLRLLNRIRSRPLDTGVAQLAEQIAALQLIELRGRGRAVVGSAALANWVLDIACLAACCAAVGAEGMTLALVLVAYAAATAASSAAFLPGGLGLVDGALLAALVAGGVPSHPALAAVLLYRLVSFVGVAAAGWVAWFVVHARETPSAALIDADEPTPVDAAFPAPGDGADEVTEQPAPRSRGPRG
ncbi:lysylphosphatidylglycerol synthase transmembrane domain-containing protein [Actinomycetospora sp. CA-101289]|uniref:lysylphosphatidylglycerol synthase transmembrane domain-containing protein n=1 Tax=Actinomycetospora sp. CA-101289 TaxID=3239893 RepID=UPI003D95C989